MNNYIYADDAAPVLPKGTIIHVTAWHDNTDRQANNPDPNQWVGWGDRTVDEMAHAWVNVTYISDEDYKEWAATHNEEAGVAFRSGGQRTTEDARQVVDSSGIPDRAARARRWGQVSTQARDGAAPHMRARASPPLTKAGIRIRTAAPTSCSAITTGISRK